MLILIGWALAASSYLLFVGQVSADETALALLCGLAATVWCAALSLAAEERIVVPWAGVSALGRAVAKIPSAAIKVAGSIIRGGPGAIVGQPFLHGRDDDPAEAGRRAVALLAVSLAPDKFALRLPPGEDSLLVHTIVDLPPQKHARWPA